MFSNFSLTSIDLIVLAVIVISGFFGAWRGIVKETLSIAGWAAALLVLFYGFTPFQPITRDFVHNPALADFITGSILFAGTLIIVSVFTHMMSKWVHKTAFGSADRSLGFVFGLIRGGLIVCMAFFLYSAAVPDAEEYPDSLKNAYTLHYIQTATDYIADFVQQNQVDDEDSLRDKEKQKADEKNKETEYKDIEKNGLEPPAP